MNEIVAGTVIHHAQAWATAARYVCDRLLGGTATEEFDLQCLRGAAPRLVSRTPAMAAGLTDHRWSFRELAHYRFTTQCHHHD